MLAHGALNAGAASDARQIRLSGVSKPVALEERTYGGQLPGVDGDLRASALQQERAGAGEAQGPAPQSRDVPGTRLDVLRRGDLAGT